MINCDVMQYSEKTGKLYVRIAVSCPFVYRIRGPPPQDAGYFCIRITPIYARPEHVREVVRRCPNHAAAAGAVPTVTSYPAVDDAESGGRVEAEKMSFVWAQHPRARYEKDPDTGRYSVVLPFEQPQGKAPCTDTYFIIMAWVWHRGRARV